MWSNLSKSSSPAENSNLIDNNGNATRGMDSSNNNSNPDKVSEFQTASEIRQFKYLIYFLVFVATLQAIFLFVVFLKLNSTNDTVNITAEQARQIMSEFQGTQMLTYLREQVDDIRTNHNDTVETALVTLRDAALLGQDLVNAMKYQNGTVIVSDFFVQINHISTLIKRFWNTMYPSDPV